MLYEEKYYYSCSIEEIGIAEEDGFITDVYFRGVRDVEADVCETDLIRKCFEEIEEYLCGKRKKFSVPVKAKGTDFQKKVWNALLHIEYGDMASYGDIARKIRSPKAFRAVGMANNRNPVMILIPCHRVVGSDEVLRDMPEELKSRRNCLRWKNLTVIVKIISRAILTNIQYGFKLNLMVFGI